MDSRHDTALTPASDLPETALVERYRTTGDGLWFEELYRRTRRKVFGVCLRILGDATKAEDACHEAFVRAYERFDSLRGDNFSAWVCRIAANRSYDEVRRQPPEERAEEPDLWPSARQVEADAITQQQLERALDIVRSLEPHQRTVFLLRHVDEKSYGEIERHTGYGAKAVKSYLQNARRNFQLAWERLGEADG